MATIEEITQAERQYADVTARSGGVEFVDKSLHVCGHAIAILQERLHVMAYLRTSILKCAGFPGLLGNKAFEPIRVRLIESLPVF